MPCLYCDLKHCMGELLFTILSFNTGTIQYPLTHIPLVKLLPRLAASLLLNVQDITNLNGFLQGSKKPPTLESTLNKEIVVSLTYLIYKLKRCKAARISTTPHPLRYCARPYKKSQKCLKKKKAKMLKCEKILKCFVNPSSHIKNPSAPTCKPESKTRLKAVAVTPQKYYSMSQKQKALSIFTHINIKPYLQQE